MVAREYNFSESIAFGLGGGIGWLLAIVALAAIREKLKYADVPPALRGLGIALRFASGVLGRCDQDELHGAVCRTNQRKRLRPPHSTPNGDRELCPFGGC